MSVDYARFFAALSGGSVEFILVGGTAANVHGSARLTQDVDVVYCRRRENVQRLVAALAPFAPYLRGAPPGLPFRWDAETIRAGLNFTLETALGPVDLLGEIVGGGGYDALLPHTIEIEAFGQKLRCLDLRKLIEVKRAAGRPKDLESIAELEALLEEGGG
jgi:predicted nucleotidyltransferase